MGEKTDVNIVVTFTFTFNTFNMAVTFTCVSFAHIRARTCHQKDFQSRNVCS